MKDASFAIHTDHNISLTQKLSRKLVLHFMTKIRSGHITLEDHFGVMHIGDQSSALHASIRIHNLEFYVWTLFQGSVGFGNAYTHKYWEVDNLTNLIGIFAQNLHVMQKVEGQTVGLFFKFFQSMLYILQPNTLRHAKSNIAAHYDLSNDFFKLFLDQSMSYSGLLFNDPQDTLDQAATNKNKVLLTCLELSPDDHLLEIGTGWGGLAIMAATDYGCQVSTTTISTQQFNYVRDTIQKLNIENQIKLYNLDYRMLSGKYSKIVSVEMIEAVGHQYYDEFFKVCSNLLEDDGLFCLQAIVIRDQEYERAKIEVDFIKKYIFPGGCLPSLNCILKATTKSSDLSLIAIKDITYDYAITLRHWRSRMLSNMQQIYQLGFDEQFLKSWEYYFSYCEAGFLQRNIMNLQLVFAKPGYRDVRQNSYSI